jgi:hypothetical protein
MAYPNFKRAWKMASRTLGINSFSLWNRSISTKEALIHLVIGEVNNMRNFAYLAIKTFFKKNGL